MEVVKREYHFKLPIVLTSRSGLDSGRKLPQTPTDYFTNGHSNGDLPQVPPPPPPHAYAGTPIAARYTSYSGLPTDPRPGSRQSPDSYRNDSGSPISMPIPVTNGGNDYGWRPPSSQSSMYSGNGNVSVTRQPSSRPDGAQAPRIPGYDRYEEPAPSPESIDDMYASLDAEPAPAVSVRPPPDILQPAFRNGESAGRSFPPAQPAQGGSLYAAPACTHEPVFVIKDPS